MHSNLELKSQLGVQHRQHLLAEAAHHQRVAAADLTRREREILRYLHARATDREIAEALCISYHTVTTHVARIRSKLGVHSRRELAVINVADV